MDDALVLGNIPLAIHLLHPSTVRISTNSCYLHSPASDVDHEEHVVTNQAEHRGDLDRQEVHADDGAQMGLDELCWSQSRKSAG